MQVQYKICFNTYKSNLKLTNESSLVLYLQILPNITIQKNKNFNTEWLTKTTCYIMIIVYKWYICAHSYRLMWEWIQPKPPEERRKSLILFILKGFQAIRNFSKHYSKHFGSVFYYIFVIFCYIFLLFVILIYNLIYCLDSII